MFRQTVRVVLGCFALSMLASGCSGGGGGDDFGPPASSIQPGSWSGSVNSSIAGGGVATLDITEVVDARSLDSIARIARGYSTYQKQVFGTWTADFSGQANDNGGTLDGIFTDGDIDGMLDSYFSNGCSSVFTAMVFEQGISGSSSTVDCSVDETATYSLGKFEGSIPDVDGSWSGQVSLNGVGTGTLTLAINQTGLNFTGTLAANFAGSSNDTSGDFAGRISGDTLFFNYYPTSSSDCPLTGSANVTGGTISGNFATFDCSQPASGSFTVNRN